MTASYEAPVTVTVIEGRGFWWELGVFLQSLASLALRFAVALPFLLPGFSMWDGFMKLSPSTAVLFSGDLQLRVFDGSYSFSYPEQMPWIAAFAMILLPAMVVIGFLTRLAALALLIIVMVMFLVAHPDWATWHLPLGAMALALVGYGPGRISFDYLIRRAWRG